MTKQILGIVDVDVDGTTLLTGDDTTLDPGGVIRVPVKGSKVHGFREEVVESKLELNVSIDSTFSVDFFRNMRNSTVTARADTGQTWLIRNAWCANPPPIGQKDGKAKITIQGPPAEEML